jgi:hypothetical protein
MSFIVGLSTMATVMVAFSFAPPDEPADPPAADPPDDAAVVEELSELLPHAVAAMPSSTTAATRATR